MTSIVSVVLLVVLGLLAVFIPIAAAYVLLRVALAGYVNRYGEYDKQKLDQLATLLEDDELREFVRQGKRFEAARRYMELKPGGGFEVNAVIHRLINDPDLVEHLSKKRRTTADSMSDAGIRDMVREGEINDAIEAYRIFTGVDAFTAREAIEEIAREMRLRDDVIEAIDENDVTAKHDSLNLSEQ